jgi:hypothetical protein
MSIKPFPFTFDTANNIIIKNNSCDNSKNTNSMRVPRVVPDLRLAENYVPGVIALVKGLCYTSLCVFGHYDDGHGNLMKALPLVILYYDHIIFRTNNSKNSILHNFIDCTSISTDIIAGAVAAHFTNSTTTPSNYASLWCWFICLIWVYHGSAHIFNVNEFIPKSLGHLATACLVLSMFLFWDVDEDAVNNNNNNALSPFSGIVKNNNNLHRTSTQQYSTTANNNNNNNTLSNIRLSPPSSLLASVDLFPYYARTISYLSLVIVDIYTLRPPLQRERDRIGMLRYGAVLFAPTTTMILACAFVLLGVLTIKIYIEYFSKESTANHIGENNSNNNNNSAPLLFYEKNHAFSKINASHCSIAANNNVNSSGLFGNYSNNNNNNNGGDDGGNNNNNNSNSDNAVKVNVFQQQPRTAIDAMDAQEAFRLAKLRYMDGRASV